MPTRNPDEIVRQIDADLLAREKADLIGLRAALGVGPLEMALLSAIFSFGIGLIVTVIFALPQDNEKLYRFMLLWTLGFIGSVVVTLEFLIRKFRLLRRYMEIMDRRLERIEEGARRRG